jgi:hypothetical protein
VSQLTDPPDPVYGATKRHRIAARQLRRRRRRGLHSATGIIINRDEFFQGIDAARQTLKGFDREGFFCVPVRVTLTGSSVLPFRTASPLPKLVYKEMEGQGESRL